MVVKVNGRVQEGLWFSADVIFATLTVSAGDFVDDAAGVNNVNANGLDKVIEILESRGTVLGISIAAASPTVLQLILDYGQALGSSGTTVGNQTAQDVLVEIQDEINLIDLSGALPVAGPDLASATFSLVGTNFAAVAA
ncbi:MAG: hypothetical protein ACTSPB_16565 [Candidatus Thorarchaeota archaeon]